VATRPRSRYAAFAFLGIGIAVTAYLAKRGPHEQHVRFMLGDAASEVTGLEVQYLDADGDVARETRLSWPSGAAPRVVPHEPELPDGAYKIKVDIGTRERRVSVERSVTLTGGSAQVDLSAALVPSARESERDR
jgi:hypothetical protein